jgi:hypothetical protein
MARQLRMEAPFSYIFRLHYSARISLKLPFSLNNGKFDPNFRKFPGYSTRLPLPLSYRRRYCAAANPCVTSAFPPPLLLAYAVSPPGLL